MDNRQSATKDKRKMGDSNENPVQSNNNMDSECESQENIGNIRRKQETDPLKMGHVLEKVFSFLDTDSIKAARQVNPLWGIEGAKSLITKCYVKIPPQLKIEESSTNNNLMEEFKQFLSHKSKDFPVIPNIFVEAPLDVELWKSLGVIGHQVKSLRFELSFNQNIFPHELLNLLPKLNYLNFQGQTLYGNRKRAIISDIISVVSKRENGGSPLTISSLFLALHDAEQLADMEKLADCKNIMIKELTLYCCSRLASPNNEARIVNLVSKLLSTNKNVLKRLTLNDCRLVTSLLEFPLMNALTHLDLVCWPPQSSGCKFAPSFRFSEKVPNLQEISVDCSSISTDFFQYLLENAGTAPSVKRVNCINSYANYSVDALFKAFPNTEELKLSVDWNSALKSKLRSLWRNGKNLKKLTLDIEWFLVFENCLDLDLLFTGFDTETVNKIKKAPNLDRFTCEELDKLRVHPSISNLKELEHLSIHFYFGSDVLMLLKESYFVGMTKRMLTVTAKYGIDQLPKNPRIFIAIENDSRIKDAFEEVSKLPNFIFQFRDISPEFSFKSLYESPCRSK